MRRKKNLELSKQRQIVIEFISVKPCFKTQFYSNPNGECVQKTTKSRKSIC